LIANADVVIGLEATDLWTSLNSFRDQLERTNKPATRPDVKVISVTSGDLYIKANYQDFYRYTAVDLAIAADAEATLPSLIEEVKRQTTSDRRIAFQARGSKLAAARKEQLAQARTDASYGWDARPVSTARLATELWAQIKDEDWSMVSDVRHLNMWPLKLWDFQKHYQYIGISGGGGVGYNAPATAGAALANRKYGRLSVNIQCDGDLLFAPTVLWTCAHHRIPILNVMFNNRAYHEELMHIQRMANRHNRGIAGSTINVGTVFDDPFIDFSKLAQSMGVYGEGPIENPSDLAPAIRRAIAVVKRGQPALIDVVTQPR
jgi:acetolactate synthase-1/2/3 large subunit